MNVAYRNSRMMLSIASFLLQVNEVQKKAQRKLKTGVRKMILLLIFLKMTKQLFVDI